MLNTTGSSLGCVSKAHPVQLKCSENSSRLESVSLSVNVCKAKRGDNDWHALVKLSCRIMYLVSTNFTINTQLIYRPIYLSADTVDDSPTFYRYLTDD